MLPERKLHVLSKKRFYDHGQENIAGLILCNPVRIQICRFGAYA